MNKKEILGLCEFLKLHGYENTDNISKFIFGLQQENKQLKDNWNKLKKYINEANEDLYYTNNYDDILYIMQELEQGSDSNAKK